MALSGDYVLFSTDAHSGTCRNHRFRPTKMRRALRLSGDYASAAEFSGLRLLCGLFHWLLGLRIHPVNTGLDKATELAVEEHSRVS
jgi:hypothetical protein